MNILFVESSIPPYRGGVQRVSWVLRNFFLKHDYDVFFAYYLKDSAEVENTHKLKYDSEGKAKDLYPIFKSFIKLNHIDVLILQDHCGKQLLHALSMIKEKSDIKIIGCFHLSPDYQDYTKSSLLSKVKELIKKVLLRPQYKEYLHFYNVVDKFILLSTSFIEEMCVRFKFPDKKKIACIPNPLSFEREMDQNDLIKKHKIVLIVARLEETQKNIMSALRIWKKAEDNVTSNDWTLVLGGYGPDENKILTYADSLNLNNFKFIGKVDDAQVLFQSASIFMMTSRYEGFGMTLTEALQNGCVPIAFDNFTVLHDILDDGMNGIIIPSGDEECYAQKLLSLMNNNSERKAMAIRGIESCKKFSIDTVGEKWINLFKTL